MGKIIIHLHLVWNKIRASSGIVPVINVHEDDVNNRFYKCLVDMKNFMKIDMKNFMKKH